MDVRLRRLKRGAFERRQAFFAPRLGTRVSTVGVDSQNGKNQYTFYSPYRLMKPLREKP